MADDKSLRHGRDRGTVAGGQDYEIRYFAEKNGVSTEQARELIDRCGNDRDMLEREVAKLKRSA